MTGKNDTWKWPVIDDYGLCWLPDPDGKTASAWTLHEGVRMAHYPGPDDADSVILHLLGGHSSDEGLVVVINAQGLRSLARDLLDLARRIS